MIVIVKLKILRNNKNIFCPTYKIKKKKKKKKKIGNGVLVYLVTIIHNAIIYLYIIDMQIKKRWLFYLCLINHLKKIIMIIM